MLANKTDAAFLHVATETVTSVFSPRPTCTDPGRDPGRDPGSSGLSLHKPELLYTADPGV